MCPRCREHDQFDNELAVHLRDDARYGKRAMEPHDWIDVATEKRLAGRVREPNLSDEVKWTKINNLLFPEDTLTPSPCTYELLPLQVEDIQIMTRTTIAHERDMMPD